MRNTAPSDEAGKTGLLDPIAIIGMSCQLPGASDIPAYWDLIKNNRQATGAPPADRADLIRQAEELGISVNGGYIDNYNAFDAARFHIPEREAALMDPQQKLVLTNVCKAIEDAGLAVSDLKGGRTGVFVGAMANDLTYIAWRDIAATEPASMTGNGLCLIANRVSYELDFGGPSMTIDTACSSSLVALHQAMHALRNDECDYALVAGVNIILSPLLHNFYANAGIGTQDGSCKSFSSHANGVGRAEGVAVILVCKLSQAVQRQDAAQSKVYATISGSSVNNGGQSSRFTAPNVHAQIALLQRSHRQAGISPDQLSYIEGHGTGTRQGDHLEIQALKEVFKERTSPCPLGSVKSLISHTEAAAGLAGFIKAALMLYHRHIPPSLFADTPAERLGAYSPIALIHQSVALNSRSSGEGIYHIGVSSFGLGGTNAHTVLSSHTASS